MLVARGLAIIETARRFLAPSLEDLHDPLLMRDMDRGSRAALAGYPRGREILIYGDYDVDGTTSVVLLTKAIELAGGDGELSRAASLEGRLRHARRR